MGKGRIEAFSDAVIAVIITIMVLELHVPESADPAALLAVWPHFLSYAMSFVFVGIYWNSHHHLLHTAAQVDGGIMWANNFLLFCLSLVPFTTDWMGETHFATFPVVAYGLVLLMSGIAFYILAHLIIRLHGVDSPLAKALGRDWKGIASPALYVLGIVLSFVHPYIGFGTYMVVALMWVVPDRRIERQLIRKG